jgi:hypothetical protein
VSHGARASGSVLNEGVIVAVSDPLVASIWDPGVGFSLIGHHRCIQNREFVRLSVTANH